MLVSVVTGPTIQAALLEIEKSTPLADAVELRLDHFEEKELLQLGQLVAACSLPLIFTFRKAEQGGAKQLPESERLLLLEKLLELQPAFCDLEADTDPQFIERCSKRFPRIKWIGSHHDFASTPADLPAVLERMKNPHFSIYKIAVKANSTLDMLRTMVFASEQADKVSLCCISMGEYGKPSRILGPIVGNALDYSALEEEKAHLHRYNLHTLHDIFGYRRLNRHTRIYGLVGDPVEQSPGHIFHNAHFRKSDRNAVYVKMRLQSEELSEFFSLLEKLPFSGLSVTIPLKEKAIPFLDKLTSAAQAIGAVNTIAIENGRKTGSNTDAPGALDAIERCMNISKKKIAILGAGGTARAIAFEAMRRGATVAIFNRTPERAHELAAEMNCAGYALSELPSFPYDLLINTTAPSPDGASPIPDEQILPACSAMDVVYHPKETPLLKAAKEKGCPCIYGEEMFVNQALLQQEAWDF